MTSQTSQKQSTQRHNLHDLTQHHDLHDLIQKYTPQQYQQFQPISSTHPTAFLTTPHAQSASYQPQIVIDGDNHYNILEADDEYYDDYYNSQNSQRMGMRPIDTVYQDKVEGDCCEKLQLKVKAENRKQYYLDSEAGIRSETNKALQIVTPSKPVNPKYSNPQFINPLQPQQHLPFNATKMIEQILEATEQHQYQSLSASLGMKGKNLPKFKMRKEMENVLRYLQDGMMPREYVEKFEKLLDS